jgi:hypothetical protein
LAGTLPTARAVPYLDEEHHTDEGFKVELVDTARLWGERRYTTRLNGKPTTDLCASAAICGKTLRVPVWLRRSEAGCEQTGSFLAASFWAPPLSAIHAFSAVKFPGSPALCVP